MRFAQIRDFLGWIREVAAESGQLLWKPGAGTENHFILAKSRHLMNITASMIYVFP